MNATGSKASRLIGLADAGIPSFTSFPYYDASEASPTTTKALVYRFRDKPLEFQPGEKWSSSNSGYVLLGYLLEKISGQTYEDCVTQNIFKPPWRRDSGYDSNSAIISHRASGYSPSPNGPINSGYIDMTEPFSAGALYSTTHDLLRWEQVLYGGKILTAASLKKMTAPNEENYGCGLIITTAKGSLQYEHGGGIEGFNIEMAYYPADKLTVIALANLNGGAPGDIVGKLAAVVKWCCSRSVRKSKFRMRLWQSISGVTSWRRTFSSPCRWMAISFSRD